MSGFFWLTSYPKSGNTWLRLALHSLMHDGAEADFSSPLSLCPVASDRHTFDSILNVESSDLTLDEINVLRPQLYEAQAENSTKPMFRKVHDAYIINRDGKPVFPPSVTLGTVYIVRDPRDVAVSYAVHANTSIDRQITLMADPKLTIAGGVHGIFDQIPQTLMDWTGHLDSWLNASGRPILLLRYEDMLQDPISSLDQLARYIGLKADPDLLARVADATRFSKLRQAEDKHGFQERQTHAPRFFRRGVANGWKDSLTDQQVQLIQSRHGPMMKRMGYQLV